MNSGLTADLAEDWSEVNADWRVVCRVSGFRWRATGWSRRKGKAGRSKWISREAAGDKLRISEYRKFAGFDPAGSGDSSGREVGFDWGWKPWESLKQPEGATPAAGRADGSGRKGCFRRAGASGHPSAGELHEGLFAGRPITADVSDGTDPSVPGTMTEQTSTIETLDALRGFIHTTLCDKESLVREQFLMSETPLVLYGAPCGLQFTIRGPRSIRLSAVWASDPNMVYFYDARGERFLKIQLKNRFEILMATAA